MGINEATNKFMDDLTNLINNSGLPPVNVRMALELARAQVIDIEKKAVENEAIEEAEKSQEASETKAAKK